MGVTVYVYGRLEFVTKHKVFLNEILALEMAQLRKDTINHATQRHNQMSVDITECIQNLKSTDTQRFIYQLLKFFADENNMDMEALSNATSVDYRSLLRVTPVTSVNGVTDIQCSENIDVTAMMSELINQKDSLNDYYNNPTSTKFGPKATELTFNGAPVMSINNELEKFLRGTSNFGARWGVFWAF